MHTDHPDEKSIMTYVSSLYEMFPKEPTVQETLQDNVSDMGSGVIEIYIFHSVLY